MSRIYIDDQDLSKVTYNGTWVRGGSASEHDGTVASSTVVGDNFTVTFKGTSIAVYGTIDTTSEGVVTTYSIDGAPAAQATAQSGSGDTFQQQFWKSDQLALAEHKLVVTMAKVNFDPQPGEGTVWFDYFLATDPTITSSTGPRPSSTLPPINNPQQHIQVGAIIGGVIGGLFFLLALVIFLAFCRRHNKQSHVEDFERKPDNSYSTPHNGSVQPFLLGLSDLSSRNSMVTGNGDFDPTLMIAPAPLPSRKSLLTVRQTVPSLSSPPGLSTISDVEVSSTHTSGGETLVNDAGNAPVEHGKRRRPLRIDVPPSSQNYPETQPPTRQHVDSGVRASAFQTFNSLGVPSPVELPPVYSPV